MEIVPADSTRSMRAKSSICVVFILAECGADNDRETAES
jgi:hypothetical protein